MGFLVMYIRHYLIAGVTGFRILLFFASFCDVFFALDVGIVLWMNQLARVPYGELFSALLTSFLVLSQSHMYHGEENTI